jgi:hypothetical protein
MNKGKNPFQNDKIYMWSTKKNEIARSKISKQRQARKKQKYLWVEFRNGETIAIK